MSNRKYYRPFKTLWPDTEKFLEARGAVEIPVQKDFADYFGAKGLIRIQSREWELYAGERLIANCRLVHIHGAATDIINTMCFSTIPHLLPSFTAELLTFGQSPKLVFIDLQVPGATSERTAHTAEVLFPLQSKYSDLPCPGDPPDWAIAYSAGGYVFSRPEDQKYGLALCELYGDYLSTWGLDLSTRWLLIGEGACTLAAAPTGSVERRLKYLGR